MKNYTTGLIVQLKEQVRTLADLIDVTNEQMREMEKSKSRWNETIQAHIELIEGLEKILYGK